MENVLKCETLRTTLVPHGGLAFEYLLPLDLAICFACLVPSTSQTLYGKC